MYRILKVFAIRRHFPRPWMRPRQRQTGVLIGWNFRVRVWSDLWPAGCQQLQTHRISGRFVLSLFSTCWKHHYIDTAMLIISCQKPGYRRWVVSATFCFIVKKLNKFDKAYLTKFTTDTVLNLSQGRTMADCHTVIVSLIDPFLGR